MSIKLTIHGIGSGKCALSGKDETEGLSVAFENEPQAFLSFKSFKMILAMKAAQLPKEPAKLEAPRVVPPIATPALPQNGAVTVAK